jgi:predicted nucleic acid-binding protein
MTNILLDTNIILDIALKRDPFFDAASEIFSLIDEGKIYCYITATTITDIYYIASKEKNRSIAKEFIKNLIRIVGILGVDQHVIYRALESDIKDFEDAIQVSSANYSNVNIIVTRNKQDFIDCGLNVYTPGELIRSIS